MSYYVSKLRIDDLEVIIKDANAQDLIINETYARKQADNELGSRISVAYLEYFRDKTICVIGDSISDETTFPPNWVSHFREIVAKVGATVVNASVNGASFASFANEGIAKLVEADIYILFLGVNDFQAQFPFYGDKSNYAIIPCVGEVFSKIYSKNPNADFYYISPIKICRQEVQNYEQPLNMYRWYYETYFSMSGFSVISGYNAPNLSIYSQNIYLADTLHPNTTYAPILCDYILKNVLNRCSTFTHSSVFRKDKSNDALIGTGFLTLFNTDNKFTYDIVLNNCQLTTGWNDICDVPNCLTKYCILISNLTKTGYVPVLTQISNGKLQVYSNTTETVNLSGNINLLSWCINSVNV